MAIKVIGSAGSLSGRVRTMVFIYPTAAVGRHSLQTFRQPYSTHALDKRATTLHLSVGLLRPSVPGSALYKLHDCPATGDGLYQAAKCPEVFFSFAGPSGPTGWPFFLLGSIFRASQGAAARSLSGKKPLLGRWLGRRTRKCYL